MWEKSQKTRFLRPLTVIFSSFAARALLGYLVYGFLMGRVTFPGLFLGKQGMAQWLERSPPINVARVQIPAATPYVG